MKSQTELLGTRIKKLREEKGITQSELAEKVGYKNHTIISKIENGNKGISSKKLEKIASVLNTTPAYLLGWETSEKTKENKSDKYYIDTSILTSEQKVELEAVLSMNSGLFMRKGMTLSEEDEKKIRDTITNLFIKRIKELNEENK